MKRLAILHIGLAMLACIAVGCHSGKPTASKASPYERKPITEVTAERLDIDARLIDAAALDMADRHAEALEAYAHIVATHPTEAAAWYEMARMLGARGWTDSTVACAERAAQLEPNNRWYSMLLVQTYAQAGRHSDAIRAQRKLIALDPDNLENYYTLSNLYIDLGDMPAAAEALDLVEQRIGITEPISLQKQRLWEAAGKPDRAMREIEALAESLPNAIRYNAILAAQYMKQGKYAKAKQCYDRLLQADPTDEYIHVQLAEYYASTSQPARADAEMMATLRHPTLACSTKLQLLASFYTADDLLGERCAPMMRLADSLVWTSPFYEGHLFCGQAQLQRNQYAPALRHFRQALELDSTDYTPWEGTLICSLILETPSDTLLPLAKRAASLFPTHTLPIYVQAQQALLAKRYDECLSHLASATKWGFNHGYLEFECYELMAEAHYRLGHYDEAWRAFDHCLALNPDEPSVLNNYAYYLSEQHLRLDEALKMAEQSLRLDPTANTRDTYGWILHLLGRDREARTQLRTALEASPSNATFRQHLQEVEKALGR